MLLLSFSISDDKYVIDTRDIIEVTTLVRLKELPGSIHGVVGLLNYHGSAVPIIDISELCGKPAQENTLTTRIIIVNYINGNVIGIKAENVTETIRVNDDAFEESGIKVNKNNFLGDVAEVDNRFIQLINTDQLLTDEVRECLFPEKPQMAGLN